MQADQDVIFSDKNEESKGLSPPSKNSTLLDEMIRKSMLIINESNGCKTPEGTQLLRKSLNMSIDSASPAVLEIGDFEEEDEELLKLKMFSEELKFGNIVNYSESEFKNSDVV